MFLNITQEEILRIISFASSTIIFTIIRWMNIHRWYLDLTNLSTILYWQIDLIISLFKVLVITVRYRLIVPSIIQFSCEIHCRLFTTTFKYLNSVSIIKFYLLETCFSVSNLFLSLSLILWVLMDFIALVWNDSKISKYFDIWFASPSKDEKRLYFLYMNFLFSSF